jgi:hypothetical protein
MTADPASNYFQISPQALTPELTAWICAHHKALWQYHGDILLETSVWDGIMFRLKFAERFAALPRK